MKIRYFDQYANGGSENTFDNSTISSSKEEGALLFSCAVLGTLGNVFIILLATLNTKFRLMSSAFLIHHCLLDAIKSLFCIPFGYSLLMRDSIPHCDVIGAAYMLLMTVSAYNLLALLLNEEYQCTHLFMKFTKSKSDACCITFGIVMIWFTTVLLHLGVAFLPSHSEFSKDIGNCVYRYGITKNYVIHVLWVLLVTGAILVATFTFIHFYKKLNSTIQFKTWSSVHKSLSSQSQRDFNNHPLTTSQHSELQEEEVHYQFEEDAQFLKTNLEINTSICRIIILFCMLLSFIICWYPLFLLTLIDASYSQPASIYRALTIVAWAHPLTTPIFCAFIYFNRLCSKGNQWGWRAVFHRHPYTRPIPMTASRSHSGNNYPQTRGPIQRLDQESTTLSFHNHNFSWEVDQPNNITTNHHPQVRQQVFKDKCPQPAISTSTSPSSSSRHRDLDTNTTRCVGSNDEIISSSCNHINNEYFINYNTEDGHTLIL